MATDLVLVEKKGFVGTLTLNRPEKRNALSPDLLIQLCRILDEFGRSDEVRAVVIRGAGDRAFSSGYDITALPAEVPPEIRGRLRDENYLDLAIESIGRYPFPVIAMLNGDAFGGGCELAVSCDLRIAADDIRMGMPPARLGLVYPLNGLVRFVQILGFPAVKELFFSGRYYQAPRIQELGLVHYLQPPDQLEAFTFELTDEIAGHAPLSIKGTKRILNILQRSWSLSEEDRREIDGIVLEALRSEDHKEGKRAFLEKRRPVFHGR